MPCADRRLRSASSPISVAVRHRQRRNVLSGKKSVRHVPGLFCQLSPRPLSLAQPIQGSECGNDALAFSLGPVIG
jgi:hypothetical protein